jgi:microcompartment protein CcmL/EutN
MNEAVGMIEVFGLVTAFVAADAACKAGNVTIETFDKNKPGNADALPVPLLVLVKIRGSVADVKAAMEAAEAAANGVSGVSQKYIIARPDQDTEKMLRISAI